jgi:hypothetical protein
MHQSALTIAAFSQDSAGQAGLKRGVPTHGGHEFFFASLGCGPCRM